MHSIAENCKGTYFFPCSHADVQEIVTECVTHWCEFGPNEAYCGHDIPHTNLITM
jgi:hypothetical protein